MKHQAIARIRGLLITLDHSKDPELLAWSINEIVVQLRILNKVVLSLKEQNKARPLSPG